MIRADETSAGLLGFSCAQLAAAGLMVAGSPYFATYPRGGPNAGRRCLAASVGPILVTMPLWNGISHRVEKRGAMVAAAALFLTGPAGLVTAPVFGAPYAYACPPDQNSRLRALALTCSTRLAEATAAGRGLDLLAEPLLQSRSSCPGRVPA